MGVFEHVVGDERLTSAMLSDALDECGLRSQVLETRLAPVVAGSRAFGRAATVRFVPSEADQPDDPYGEAIDFISGLKRGELVVIATAESNVSAFWGELFSAAAIGVGSVGGADRRQPPGYPEDRRAGLSRFRPVAAPHRLPAPHGDCGCTRACARRRGSDRDGRPRARR